VTGIVHLGLSLLVNWPPPLSHPSPKPSPLQIPRTPTAQRLTKTTSGIFRLLLSGTIIYQYICWFIQFLPPLDLAVHSSWGNKQKLSANILIAYFCESSDVSRTSKRYVVATLKKTSCFGCTEDAFYRRIKCSDFSVEEAIWRMQNSESVTWTQWQKSLTNNPVNL
jgi:hypothetical protein